MKMSIKNLRSRPLSRPFMPAALAAAVLAACGGSDGDSAAPNTKPSYLGAISETTYDGTSNDLLTAGLGASGLAAAAPPAFADPLQPTAAELRRAAIHANYRAMLDDPTFWRVVKNTAVFAALSIPIYTVVALVIAAMLAGRVRFSRFYQACVFIPTLVPLIASAMVWMWLLTSGRLVLRSGASESRVFCATSNVSRPEKGGSPVRSE